MKYLALAASMQLSAHTQTLHATGRDAKSVLDNVPGRSRKLQHVPKSHHFLLQCIDEVIHCGSPFKYYLRSHAYTRKLK